MAGQSHALPTFVELRAPESWRSIDFISDLHLSHTTPQTLAAFAEYLRGTSADAVFILGDLFEVWVGDDSRHAGFEAHFTELLAEASGRLDLAFMRGNRDFLLGPEMLQACGMRALDDPTVLLAYGQRVMLTHGDSLCLADLPYQRFRAEVRSEEWQARFLAQPLEDRRRMARSIRDESQSRKSQQLPSDWVDIDTTAASDWMRAADVSVLIHGHTHRPASELMATGLTRHVLSDWDLDAQGQSLRSEVLRWDADGLRRMAPL